MLVSRHLFAVFTSWGKDEIMACRIYAETGFNHTSKNTDISDAFKGITDQTSLAELIAVLGPVRKYPSVPTSRALRENGGEPVVLADQCEVYANGYTIYENESGRTVMWLPACTKYTYSFVKPKDSEVGLAPDKVNIPDGYLESLPWPIVVTLAGEDRIEKRVRHRSGDRSENTKFSRNDNDEDGTQKSNMEEQLEWKDHLREGFCWREDQFGENPESVLIRKEKRDELLNTMTEKQREVFILYYRYGYTQQEIAKMLGVSRVAVRERLRYSLKKA